MRKKLTQTIIAVLLLSLVLPTGAALAAPLHESSVPTHRERLEELVSYAGGVEREGAPIGDWTRFMSALTAARNTLANQNATDQQLIAAYNNLRLFLNALLATRPTIRDRLEDLVEESKRIERGNYSAASWTRFMSALTAARRALANPYASDAQLYAAYRNLTTMRDNLRRV